MRKVPTRSKKRRAPFLTFEGPEGSGKTTQIAMLAEVLRRSGCKILCTREPGGTGFGDAVRSLLLDHSDERMEPLTELFMMLAQRNEHLQKLIFPALEGGVMVLCDRYFDSSIAYQGFGRGLDPDQIYRLHKNLLGNCIPDATYLFEIEPSEGLQRAKMFGNRKLDRMESEALEFHGRVRNGYIETARKFPRRFVVLDASKSPEAIFSELKHHVDTRFRRFLS